MTFFGLDSVFRNASDGDARARSFRVYGGWHNLSSYAGGIK